MGGVLLHSSKPVPTRGADRHSSDAQRGRQQGRDTPKKSPKVGVSAGQTGGLVGLPPELVKLEVGLFDGWVGPVFDGVVGEAPEVEGELGTGLFCGSGTRDGG